MVVLGFPEPLAYGCGIGVVCALGIRKHQWKGRWKGKVASLEKAGDAASINVSIGFPGVCP
jgi:hypothetical protein